MHDDVQLRLSERIDILGAHAAAEYMADFIACRRQEAHEFPCIVLPVVVGGGHADEVDAPAHGWLRRPKQHLKRRTGSAPPSICKAPDQSAAVKGNNGTGHPCGTYNRADIVTD